MSKDGKAAVRINYPEDDAQCRESYVGSVVRQRPHGYGLLKWRKGNYVRFEGQSCYKSLSGAGRQRRLWWWRR